MATNIVYDKGEQLSLNVSGVTGSGTAGAMMSGDPGVIGQLPFVALTNEDADGNATCKFNGVADVSVMGETNADAGSAVAVGDILYFDAADTPRVNKDTTGVRFGYALEAVASGATSTIRVKIGY